MNLLKKPYLAVIPQLNRNFLAQRFTEKHYSEVMDVFTHAFCNSEPMTHYIDMQYHEFKPFAEAVVNQAILDGLSSVIIEKNSGCLAALSLVEDLTQPASLEDIQLTKKFQPILGLLEQLSKDYFTLHQPKKNEIAHLFITAVADQYRGLSLSTHANFHAMKLAKERNFVLMLSELTNSLNEIGIIPYLHGYKECIGSITYNEFILENQKPFSELSGEAHAYLWSLPDIIKYK